MRIDLEQFLALTVALGTAGAVGVAGYTSYQNRADATETPAVEMVAESDNTDDWPSADLTPPAPAPEPAPKAEPPTMPAFDAEPAELEAAPGPQVEGAW
ncbi:MAG: hypothetical protein K0V04_44100 [Deltaproteobacteria bacterium]|nr:hypothetical protein [Deltaproteobacteria bacterium]